MSDQEIYDAVWKRLRAHEVGNTLALGGFVLSREIMGNKDSYVVSFIRVYEKRGFFNSSKKLVFCRVMTLNDRKKSVEYDTLVKLSGNWVEKLKAALNA